MGYKNLNHITISLYTSERKLENNLVIWKRPPNLYEMKRNFKKTRLMVIAKKDENVNIKIKDTQLKQKAT